MDDSNFGFHDFRHLHLPSYDGYDLVTVKNLPGHTGIIMTLRYSHMVFEHKAQVAKLEERFLGNVTSREAARYKNGTH